MLQLSYILKKFKKTLIIKINLLWQVAVLSWLEYNMFFESMVTFSPIAGTFFSSLEKDWFMRYFLLPYRKKLHIFATKEMLA